MASSTSCAVQRSVDFVSESPLLAARLHSTVAPVDRSSSMAPGGERASETQRFSEVSEHVFLPIVQLPAAVRSQPCSQQPAAGLTAAPSAEDDLQA